MLRHGEQRRRTNLRFSISDLYIRCAGLAWAQQAVSSLASLMSFPLLDCFMFGSRIDRPKGRFERLWTALEYDVGLGIGLGDGLEA